MNTRNNQKNKDDEDNTNVLSQKRTRKGKIIQDIRKKIKRKKTKKKKMKKMKKTKKMKIIKKKKIVMG